MNTATIETREIETKSSAIVERARATEIIDDATFAAGAELLKGIKGLRKAIDDTFDGPIMAAHKAHKEICAAKKKHEGPLLEAESIIKGRIGIYTEEQERIRRAEQARLEAVAKKREEDARLAEAAQLEQSGDHEEAERVISAPVEVPTVVMPRATPKVAGVSTRENWDAQVTDLLALVKHVAANPDLLHLLQPNVVALRQQAKSLKDQLRIPGVKAVMTRTVTSGAA